MSDWSKPTTTSNYSTEFIQQLDARLKDLAYGLDPVSVPSYTGLPANSVRINWRGSNITLDFYNGTTWATIAKTINMTATAATTLATARSLALTGDGTATLASFNGSANVTAGLTLTSVNATTTVVGSSTTIPVLQFDSKGRATSVSSVSFANTITAGGSVTSSDITLKTGTGDVTLARLQTNAGGTLLYLGTGSAANAISPDNIAATLTNKTISLGSNSFSGTFAQFNTSLTDEDFVGVAATQTLTYKTLSTGSSWNGNTIGATYGGTGINSYTTGDLLYCSATNTLSKLATVAAGNVLRSGATPSWGKVNLTTDVSGVLPAANGGFITTGLTGLLYANDSSAATVATGAQIVSAIGTTSVANATYATSAGSVTNGMYITGTQTVAGDKTFSSPITGSTSSMSMSQDSGATKGSFICRASGTGDANLAGLALWNDAYAIKFGVRADGYIGIGGWSRGAWSWYSDPSGNMVAAGNVTAYSDPRLKRDFTVLKNPLDILRNLDGGSFYWKSGIPHIANKADKLDYGVLADQVEKILPEIVTESIEIDGISYKTVAYEKLIPILLEAVKELDRRLSGL